MFSIRSGLVALIALATPASVVRSQSAKSILGEWRVVRAVVAPWVKDGVPSNGNERGWVGHTIRFEPRRVAGPGVLSCARAVYKPSRFGADALFQGNLPAPAKKSAEALGLVRMPVRGVTLDCDSGLFELHDADANSMLLALDNVIYTLDRSPGALAPDTSPAGVVQRLLELHFAGDMGFDAETVERKRAWLTERLRARIARYLAKPVPPNDVPAIDGDPFTDSQEYPTRFSVGRGAITGDRATVTVRFGDGYRVRPVRYLLRRERGAWRVDDLRFEGGETFGGLLD